MMEEFEGRFHAIDVRLKAIEEALKLRSAAHPSSAASASIPSPPRQTARPVSSATPPTPIAIAILGWGSMTALILAASYLIRLAITVGWLTP